MVNYITGDYLPVLNSENRAETFLNTDGVRSELDARLEKEDAVSLSISRDAHKLLSQTEGEFVAVSSARKNYSADLKKKNRSGRENNKERNDNKLSEEEKATVEELRKIDSEVRAHESSHFTAAGRYAVGGPVYEYERGPDGRMYAVDGYVDIDVSEESTPEETIEKARTLRSAMSTVSNMSAADQGIAARASQMEAKAREEAFGEEDDEKNGPGGNSDLSAKVKAAYSPAVGYSGKYLNVVL